MRLHPRAWHVVVLLLRLASSSALPLNRYLEKAKPAIDATAKVSAVGGVLYERLKKLRRTQA